MIEELDSNLDLEEDSSAPSPAIMADMEEFFDAETMDEFDKQLNSARENREQEASRREAVLRVLCDEASSEKGVRWLNIKRFGEIALLRGDLVVRIDGHELVIEGDDPISEDILGRIIILLQNQVLKLAELQKIFGSGKGSVHMTTSMAITPTRFTVKFIPHNAERWLKRFETADD